MIFLFPLTAYSLFFRKSQHYVYDIAVNCLEISELSKCQHDEFIAGSWRRVMWVSEEEQNPDN